MGMAASQARLLSITARIHDVEYQAQSIQNAKVQLATQSDQVYNDYMEALDAQTLTISTIGADGSKARITANFNNLFSSNRVRPADGSIYALRNEQGKLVVENDVYNAYESFGGTDAYAFATYMLGGKASLDANASDFDNYRDNIHKKEEAVYQKNKDNTDKIAKDSTIDTLRKALEDYVSDGDIYSGNLKPEYETEEGREKYEGTLQKIGRASCRERV